METESGKVPWIIVFVLVAILVIGLLLSQPMGKDEAVDIAMGLVPEEFTEVQLVQFIPMAETEFGADIWYIELENKDDDKAILSINAGNGSMIEGKIKDGKTGEVLETL